MAGGVPVVFAFTTTETDPLNNDTVHSFCAVGITSGTEPVANQYHEVETQYYQGSASGSIPLRTVKTAFEYQNDIAHSASSSTAGHVGIINLLPTNIATTTPAGTTTDVRQYSNDNGKALFTAGRIVCNWSGGCSTLGSNSLGLQTIPISYLSPTTEIAKDAYNNSVRTTSTTFMFQNPPSIYTSAHMDALPISQTVSDSSGGAGTVSGTNGFRYDEANGSPQGTYGNLTSKSETYYLSGSSSSGHRLRRIPFITARVCQRPKSTETGTRLQSPMTQRVSSPIGFNIQLRMAYRTSTIIPMTPTPGISTRTQMKTIRLPVIAMTYWGG